MPTPPQTPQHFLLLTLQNTQLQKIIESQSQQLQLLQKQLHQLQSQNISIKNQADEIRQKCMEYRATEEKVSIVRESLWRDFGRLRAKMEEKEGENRRMEAEIARVREQLKQRDNSMLDIVQQKQMQERELSKLSQNLTAYRNQNQTLRAELRYLRLQNIDEKINNMSNKNTQESKENIYFLNTNKNSNKKTIKKKTRKIINLNTSNNCYQNQTSAL